jgi:hypothetical protein
MLRDKLKEESAYRKNIAFKENSIIELKQLLPPKDINDKVAVAHWEEYIVNKEGYTLDVIYDRQLSRWNDMIGNYSFELLFIHYSVGDDIEIMKPILSQAIKYKSKYWYASYNTYRTQDYFELVSLISLAILLGVSNEDALRLIKMRSIIQRSDFVLDTMLKRLITKEQFEEYSKDFEDYKYEIWVIGSNEPWTYIKALFDLKDKKAQEKYMKITYIKHWYRRCKKTNWHNRHKKNIDTYYGYWSFESVALTQILGLDDSSYRDNKFYPKDMIKRDEDTNVLVDTKPIIKEDKSIDNSNLVPKNPKAKDGISYGDHIENLARKEMVDIKQIGIIESLNNIPIWLEKNPNTSNPSIYENIFWEIESWGEYLYYLAGYYQKNEKGLLKFPTASTEFRVETSYEDDVIRVAKNKLAEIPTLLDYQAIEEEMSEEAEVTNYEESMTGSVEDANSYFEVSQYMDSRVRIIEVELFALGVSGDAIIEVHKLRGQALNIHYLSLQTKDL